MKILIQRGADVDLADNEGITPLHYAALSQSFVSTAVLTQPSDLCQCQANLKRLLEAGAQINSYDKVNGCSPLHDACYGGDLKCVKVRMFKKMPEETQKLQVLVEAKAVVDMPTNPAKSERNKVDARLDMSAPPSFVAWSQGAVALHYAAQENKADVVLFLLKNGAKVNLQDCKVCPPLLPFPL